MYRMIKGIALLTAIVILFHTPAGAADVELKSKAVEITLTGRQHTQFNTSSVDGALGSEFLIRRARITVEMKLNDLVSGKIQPDFGSGKLSLKDAYTKFSFGSQLQIFTGQFKRPFDIFELTSSTRILIVERTGKIRNASGFTSFSSLTEGLHYSDRDIGVKVSLKTENAVFGLDASVTNGDGANKVPSKLDADDYVIAEKQYTARVKVKPPCKHRLILAVGVTTLPIAFPHIDIAPSADTTLHVEYAMAFEMSAEFGNFQKGLHIQAGVIVGDNWAVDPDDPPSFTAAQGIVTFKHTLSDKCKISAIEPLLRVSYADPNTDAKNDAGLLVTPGIQIFFIGRTKFAVNVDIFSPQQEGADMEYSIKAQASLHF